MDRIDGFIKTIHQCVNVLCCLSIYSITLQEIRKSSALGTFQHDSFVVINLISAISKLNFVTANVFGDVRTQMLFELFVGIDFCRKQAMAVGTPGFVNVEWGIPLFRGFVSRVLLQKMSR